MIDLVCADHNLTQENFLNESPYQKLKKIFQYYPEPIVRKEVSFNENKGALERPQMFFPYAGDDVDPNEVALMDTNFIIIKEPVEINQPKFENIQLQIQELFDSPLARTDKDKIQEKVDKLLLEMNQYIGYYQTPFTGEYKNIEVPDELPEKPVFEFLITMDTEIYTVKRRVAVPADMSFVDFDKLLCHLFHWIGFPYHLSEFIFPFKDNPEGTEASEVLVWEEKDAPENPLMSPVDMGNLEYNNPFYNAKVTDIKTKKLSDYFPEFKTAQYRYDFGDNWFHSIELTGIYDESEYVKELPYLIESVGVAPADDMGGVEHFSDLLTYRFRSFDPEIYWRQIKLWLEERDNILRAPCSLKELF